MYGTINIINYKLHSRLNQSGMKYSFMTYIITMYNIVTYSIMTYGIVTYSIMKYGIVTYSIVRSKKSRMLRELDM
jgi:hypothetical protein